MKTINSISFVFLVLISVLFGLNACKDDVLTEIPLSFLNPDVVLVNKAGFESAITALHSAARDETFSADAISQQSMNIGTDAYMQGNADQLFRDYNISLSPGVGAVNQWWEWAYLKMIPRANNIIDYAERPEAKWANEAEKKAIVAEARFFRAFTYNKLANLYAGVPIVDKFISEPKLDFKRNSREEVLAFAQKDLEFAVQWLPESTAQPGRIVKAAANHLLSVVYLAQGNNDKAIEAASATINDGKHKLMTTRFGSQANLAGDVFSDLFRDNNQNLPGNTETLWALQFEFQTPGGVTYFNSNTNFGGNNRMRAWGCSYHSIKDPEGKSGTMVVDSLGRPVGWVMGTPYASYEIWKEDPKDMRNSKYNIRREIYFNNPASKYFGQKVDPVASKIDTINSGSYYPYTRKLEGAALSGSGAGRTYTEFYVMRLAETYLFRAEAYIRKGDKQKAANDINVLHARAKAKLVTADQMTLDYILDERVKELIMEEDRRLTLVRYSFLDSSTTLPYMIERIRRLNPKTAKNIEAKHLLFPIPQKFIDANIDAPIQQNPGY
jgi:starch-binding outer membrane protein, SusD/RagB family